MYCPATTTRTAKPLSLSWLPAAALAAAAALIVALPAPAAAQTSGRPDGMRFVPDVIGQVSALSERADALGLNIGTTPDPSSCKHYQGMVRVSGADGTPFFIVSRSGSIPDFEFSGTTCDDSPGETDNGNLVIFRMGSRDKNGERMRSNRRQRGVHADNTPPPAEDVATTFFTVVDGGLVLRNGPGNGLPPTRYGHPGGMQVVGDVLALALEHRQSEGSPHTLAMFLDVSNPEDPVFLSQFALVDINGNQLRTAGTMALTPLPDDHYLMAVTGGASNQAIQFYRSTSTDLRDPNLSWTVVDEWYANTFRVLPGQQGDICELSGAAGKNPDGFCLSPDEVYAEQNWPDGNAGHTHQTLQFLREGHINGPLFLAGIRGRFGSDDSIVDIYRVDCLMATCDFGDIRLRHRLSKGLRVFPNTGGEQLASFAAASVLYGSPTGELILYATEHDNDGPNGSIKAGEWRHIDVVRPGSPTLLPTALLDGPYEVDEGGAVVLTGSAAPPITKPFIQLFHGTNLLGVNPIFDYADRATDDYEDLFAFEAVIIQTPAGDLPLFHHANKARSWNWYAPPGCSVRAVDRDDNGNVDEVKTLTGAVHVKNDPDLAAVLHDGGTDDIDQEVDRIEFSSDCDQLYSTPFRLRWDLDGDGSFDTVGNTATFSAATIDGPSVVSIGAEAQSSSDGPTGQAHTFVTVRNVAPALSPVRVTDSAGLEVNAQVPFVLAGLPVNISAAFADPGLLDHHSASINWGDGAVENSVAFATFDEAFGDGNGSLSHTHRYSLPGTYSVELLVADDDGGRDDGGAPVRVVTPEQATAEIIAALDALIAGSSDAIVRNALEMARQALAGNPDASNGALEMLRRDSLQAAAAFLDQAIRWLDRAQQGGADVAVLRTLLQQVSASLPRS